MMKVILLVFTVLVVITGMVGAGCKRERNAVVDYLDNAELQYEGAEQKENIINALKDAMHLSPEILQGKRYKDYQGNEHAWDLRTVIQRHFVPSSKGKMVGTNFYYDITSEAGRKKVAEILETLKE
jgi:hypothetical protein